MRVITSWDELETINNHLTLIIGNFDGIHRGHQKLIETANRISDNTGKIALLTFAPHSAEFLTGKSFSRLTPREEMKKSLEQYPLDYWFCLPFNKDIADLEPEQFIEWITQKCRITNIVVGFNFKFGRGAVGNVEKLRELSAIYKFKLHIVPAVQLNNTAISISSSFIRNQLQVGNIELANQALGENYKLIGTVAHGKKIGRKLGYPTANIIVNEHKLIPADGVYAGIVNSKYNAAVSIGFNPSFNSKVRTVEIFILAYSGKEIYGEYISLELTHYLRNLIRFDCKEMLIEQIKNDIKEVQRLNPLC